MDRGYGENLRPYAQSSNQDQSYGGNWGNVNPGENKHSKQDVMNCEIGMWNPNTYNANKQPGSESNSAYGGSTTSNIPGSSSWYDTTAYAPNLKGSTGTASSYDMERVADSLTNINFSNMQQTQQSPWGDCGFNYDLYKDAPYYGNSQPNTNYLPAKQSSNPHSYTTSRNLQQSQQQNAALTNTASRSDGIDWRKPPASNFPGAVDPYYREADYTGSSFNQRSYEPAVQKPFATEWDKFTNPLNEVTDEDGDSAESLVKQMRDSANTSSAKFEETMKKPTSISKAALALLHDDLNTAAAPFQSSEKLKQYRNEHLGITVDQEPQSLGTDAVAKIAASSSLSVDAKEFVPNFKKQKTDAVDSSMLELIEAEGDHCFITSLPIIIPKLDLPISPDSERAKFAVKRLSSTPVPVCLPKEITKFPHPESVFSNTLGTVGSLSAEISLDEEASVKNEVITAEIEQSECRNIIKEYEKCLCWNPLDGPFPKKNELKENIHISEEDSSQYHSTAKVLKTVVPGSNGLMYEKDSKNKITETFDELELTEQSSSCHQSSVMQSNKKMQLSVLPDFCMGESYVVPLLGLFPLDILGFQSEKESLNDLKKKIKSTKDVLVDPPPESSEASSEHETIAINHMDDCINKLTVDPASFDVVVPDTLLKLRSLHISTTAISVIVDKIYEMCVVEPNFRYLGSQLCDIMSRSTTGLKHFRKTLLTKAQNEFGDVETKLKDDSVSQKRAQDFTHFMAELFLSLMAECADGKLERFQVLGRATFGVVGKLVDHPNDGNVQCAVRVLKLTVIAMQDSLKNDGRNSINKIEDILDKLTALLARAQSGEIALKDLTKNLLSGLIALRAKNWGRVSPEESYPGTFHDLKYPPVALPENDENYYMVNEPVFFTPDGVQYTAADAADSDFYQKYLARYSVSHKSRPSGHEVASDLESCYSNPMDSAILSNDSSYPNWSLGDADQYDSRSAEDDYDEELEAFMRRL